MRLHPLSIVLSIPAIFLACSSGGPGSPDLPSGPGVFGQPGATPPALAPSAPSVPGGQTGGPGPTVDSGVRDTGSSNQDTGSTTTDTGSDECTAYLTSTCSADPAPSSSQISTCRSQISGSSTPSCPSQWRALYQCIATNRVCDPSTNTTDSAATASACSSQQEAVSTCVSGG